MLDVGQHKTAVDAWFARSAKDLSPPALLRLFELALGALWVRSEKTLGEVTLTAITDRVLHNAAEKTPLFSSLKVAPNGGVQGLTLREPIGPAQTSQIMEGVRFVLVELLTVLGNLTAEILTPELHAELSRVGLPEAGHIEKGEQDNPINSKGRASQGRGPS